MAPLADSQRQLAPDPEPLGSARGLSLAGLVLCALYAAIVAGLLFPVKLLDSGWQLRFGSALINASPFPLIGLALLQLAADLEPRDPLLAARRRGAAQLAVPVAVGFLLLVPLLSVAALKQQHSQITREAALIGKASANLRALRQAVTNAPSSNELNDRLIALNGPVLNAADRVQPLPALKAQVNAVLDQAAAQVARQRQQAPPANPWLLLPELLRNAFAGLALALGFAGLAQRPGGEGSLLEELQASWHHSRQRRIWAIRNRDHRQSLSQSDQDFIDAISPDSDEDSQPPAPSNRHQ